MRTFRFSRAARPGAKREAGEVIFTNAGAAPATVNSELLSSEPVQAKGHWVFPGRPDSNIDL
jgi:hypothetical protein